jgi:cyclic pyranopterin phosphate synthase
MSTPLIDSFQRRISYLRVSVTDRCNLRCQYCMPEEDHPCFLTRPVEFEEIHWIAACFVRFGASHVRFTGRPLVRKT